VGGGGGVKTKKPEVKNLFPERGAKRLKKTRLTVEGGGGGSTRGKRTGCEGANEQGCTGSDETEGAGGSTIGGGTLEVTGGVRLGVKNSLGTQVGGGGLGGRKKLDKREETGFKIT